jgi:hypothetical protein
MTAEGKRQMRSARLIPLLIVGGALLAVPGMVSAAFGQAAQPSAPGTVVAWTTEMRATVESIDHATRQIVLRGPEGNRLALTASPEVRNLDQVRAGDQVVIRYTEALAASLAKPDERSGANVTRQEGVVRSEPGQRPGGVIGGQVRATVQVEAVDRASNTLTIIGPAGVARTIAVRDPDAQRFLQTLKAGDRVELVYTEALAMAVEPMQR